MNLDKNHGEKLDQCFDIGISSQARLSVTCNKRTGSLSSTVTQHKLMRLDARTPPLTNYLLCAQVHAALFRLDHRADQRELSPNELASHLK